MVLTYRLDASAAQVAHRFGARAGDDPWAGGPVSPGQFAPVITTGREFVAGPRPHHGNGAGDPPRRLVPRLWGVPPPGSNPEPGRSVLTVRNVDSPFWIGNLRNSEFRCLVPATALQVWGRGVDARGRRQRLTITLADQPLFALAGVWKDSEIASFALLTCVANAGFREQGHERMPAILPADPRGWAMWLNGDWDRAAGLIAPYSSSLMQLAVNGTAAPPRR